MSSSFQKNEKINRNFSESFKREKVKLIMQKKLTHQRMLRAVRRDTKPSGIQWLVQAPARQLADIRADILALERETAGKMQEILGG